MDTNTNEYKMSECLNQVFADIIKLEFLAYSIHWNMTDCPFLSVHEWTKDIYELLSNFKDEVAERIRQLDEFPLGALSAVIQWSSIGEIPLPAEKDVALPLFAENLVKAKMVANECANIANNQCDYVSLDLITRLMALYDKIVWQTKSQFNMERINELR